MRYIIDRFEEDLAVCEDEHKKIINISRKKLPMRSKEGDVLEFDGKSYIVNYNETLKIKLDIEKSLKKIWK
jgi:hypothetical protein